MSFKKNYPPFVFNTDSISGEISGAKSLDNEFLASEGVKTPPEAKNSVY